MQEHVAHTIHPRHQRIHVRHILQQVAVHLREVRRQRGKLRRVQRMATNDTPHELVTGALIPQIALQGVAQRPATAQRDRHDRRAAATRAAARVLAAALARRVGADVTSFQTVQLKHLLRIRVHQRTLQRTAEPPLLTAAVEHVVAGRLRVNQKVHGECEHRAHRRLVRIGVQVLRLQVAVSGLVRLGLRNRDQQRVLVPAQMRETQLGHVVRAAHQVPHDHLEAVAERV
mmetsp:Transcript_14222/g.42868  ORF Transcript_14222/g.42868 Transcript_14222/m.42868 type:complete len:230 (-) Transcript_14222:503-1192(-)